MRYGKTMVLTGVAAFIATVPLAAPAQTTKDKVENKMEQVKDKAKSTADEAKTAVSDRWITSKTKIALFADERVKGTQVNVDTRNGVVHLRGKVDSDDAKAAAAEVARGTEGAKAVKNDLQVVAPGARKAVDASDKDITKAVETRMSRDAQLKTVDVRADGGVVTLTGKVPSLPAAAKASEQARMVPGVKSVTNELTVGSAGK
jgi:osmotically-inducible protein OsmY